MAKKAAPPPSSSLNVVLDFKTKVALEGLPEHLQKRFLQEVTPENQPIFANFLYDLVNRDNASPNTKLMYTKNLLYLLRAVSHKPIPKITRDDILTYLHSLRRPLPLDPDQKWINTHNNRAVMYQKFFKWMTYPEQSPKERRIPDIVLLQKREAKMFSWNSQSKFGTKMRYLPRMQQNPRFICFLYMPYVFKTGKF